MVRATFIRLLLAAAVVLTTGLRDGRSQNTALPPPPPTMPGTPYSPPSESSHLGQYLIGAIVVGAVALLIKSSSPPIRRVRTIRLRSCLLRASHRRHNLLLVRLRSRRKSGREAATKAGAHSRVRRARRIQARMHNRPARRQPTAGLPPACPRSAVLLSIICSRSIPPAFRRASTSLPLNSG